ncbi:unnamed protein product [Discosporangium mesarthrocarpum]
MREYRELQIVGLLTLLSLTSAFHGPGLTHIAGHRIVPALSRSSRRGTRMRMTAEPNEIKVLKDGHSNRREAVSAAISSALMVAVGALPVGTMMAPEAGARKQGVNRPDLLPKEQTSVIDLVKFLTKGEVKRMNRQIAELEAEKGYRLRLLCQHYPETPGLAVRDYWKVDDKTIVMVADKGPEDAKGGAVNLLNFNVGDGLRLNLPSQFWQRLQNKYGNRYYVKDNGVDVAVINAFESIIYCLSSPSGFCVDPPDLKKAAMEGTGKK